jgi:hypothetical protein
VHYISNLLSEKAMQEGYWFGQRERVISAGKII